MIAQRTAGGYKPFPEHFVKYWLEGERKNAGSYFRRGLKEARALARSIAKKGEADHGGGSKRIVKLVIEVEGQVIETFI